MLVYVILNSSCHFRGVAVINNQNVLYNGMLKKMRYIDGSEFFVKDDNHSVGSLWYRKIHPWSSSMKTRVESQVELPTENVTSKQDSMEKQKQSSSKPVSKKDGTNKSSKKDSQFMLAGVKVKIEGSKNKKSNLKEELHLNANIFQKSSILHQIKIILRIRERNIQLEFPYQVAHHLE
jgi:hypothetical protein